MKKQKNFFFFLQLSVEVGFKAPYNSDYLIIF